MKVCSLKKYSEHTYYVVEYLTFWHNFTHITKPSIIYFKFFLRFLSMISLEPVEVVVLELLDALLLVSAVLLSFRSLLTARLTRLLMPVSVLLNLGRVLMYESNDL